ncbi:GNAT family N-acetyltransferase [Rhizorhabdus sp. FW153]|uniref:GNAT family N-acetyltransferase n=1 Tax=Rhizorhabdus sp. FW153 TaxID=3400216 RepID=UPI003CF254E8
MISLVPIASVPASSVEQLLDLAFGADRHGRTAYRLRAGMGAIPTLSFAAVDEEGHLLGSIQCWPIEIAASSGEVAPLILVGPVAVLPDRQRDGLGRKLVEAALAVADDSRAEPMMLIGDADYYGRFFGFTADATGGWQLPGPVDRDRLLVRLRPGQRVMVEGLLRPRTLASKTDDRQLRPA